MMKFLIDLPGNNFLLFAGLIAVAGAIVYAATKFSRKK